VVRPYDPSAPAFQKPNVASRFCRSATERFEEPNTIGPTGELGKPTEGVVQAGDAALLGGPNCAGAAPPMKYPARSAIRLPPASVNMEKPRADTGTMAWLANVCAGRAMFIVDVLGLVAGSTAPAVPTLM